MPVSPYIHLDRRYIPLNSRSLPNQKKKTISGSCCGRMWQLVVGITKFNTKAVLLATASVVLSLLPLVHVINETTGEKIKLINYNFRIGNYIPGEIRNGINTFFVTPNVTIWQFCESIFPVSFFDYKLSAVFYAAAAEEMITRGIIQDVCLKKVPEWTLKKNSPAHAHIVDHPLAKISRVALSSLIFAVAHLQHLDNTDHGCLSQFMSGIVFGAVVESSGNLKLGVMTHFLHNVALHGLSYKFRK